MSRDPPAPVDPLRRDGEGDEVATQDQVDEIVERGPAGAFAVAGIATAIVIALYLVFYVVVYLPRGSVQ